MSYSDHSVIDTGFRAQADKLIGLALQEDLNARGDITSQPLADLSKSCHAKIMAKQAGIIAGLDIARWVFETVSRKVKFVTVVSDGDSVTAGMTVAEINAATIDVLKAERTALNFLQRLSGIASLTGQYVQAVQGTSAVVLDTRKTTPGMRLMEKYAVEKGGGKNHRRGLYDMVLIKDNHITAAGSIKSAIEISRAYLQSNRIDALVEVEVSSLQQLDEALRYKVDRIMLDNMTVADMKIAVSRAAGTVELEASGGITLSNIRTIAETGVNFISIGALTHSAKALDLSLLIEGNNAC